MNYDKTFFYEKKLSSATLTEGFFASKNIGFSPPLHFHYFSDDRDRQLSFHHKKWAMNALRNDFDVNCQNVT